MNLNIEYIKSNTKVLFESLKDRDCFYSGGVLYMKIMKQDLEFYGINNINAISILNAGLTFFQSDEKVNKAIRNTNEPNRRFFHIHYNDGIYAETIVFTNKSEESIKSHLENRIAEYNLNPNKLYHVSMDNIKESI